MRRWLALGLLALALGCEEKGDWGPNCRAYMTQIEEECAKHKGKSQQWGELCDPFLKAIGEMRASIPTEGTTQKKFDAVEEQCAANLRTFEGKIKEDPELFPR